MNLSPRLVSLLRSAGHDAVHWSEVGAPETPDIAVISWARIQKMVLLTHDLDFGALLAAGAMNGPSVIQVRSDRVDVDLLAKRTVAVLVAYHQELARGALITLDLVRERIRLLPINRQMSSAAEDDL